MFRSLSVWKGYRWGSTARLLQLGQFKVVSREISRQKCCVMRALWVGFGQVNQECFPLHLPLELEEERSEADVRRFWGCLWEQGPEPAKRIDQGTLTTPLSLDLLPVDSKERSSPVTSGMVSFQRGTLFHHTWFPHVAVSSLFLHLCCTEWHRYLSWAAQAESCLGISCQHGPARAGSVLSSDPCPSTDCMWQKDPDPSIGGSQGSR